jgi:cytidylate kinase
VTGEDSRNGAGIVIPVDGPAGSGKSTMAKIIAERLGWDYLESGALYRAVGLKVLEGGENPDDPDAAARHARNLHFECRKTRDGWRNFLDSEDVTDKLREECISEASSKVSAVPEVREALLEFQRSYGRDRGALLDGRDIGTVVFPKVELKFFMDADVEVRIKRRFSELREKGIDFDPDQMAANLRERDQRDRERATAPLRPADDAILVDTSNKTIDQILDYMIGEISREYGQLIDLR